MALLAAACTSCRGDLPRMPVEFVEIVTYGQSGSPAAERDAQMQLPAYLRMDADGHLWTLDTGRKGAVRLARSPQPDRIEGRPGHGPGEISVALGMDISPAGVVWVADPGNAKVVAYQAGQVVSEFMVDHAPLGVVATSDSSVWVGGDLMNTLLVEYDRDGRKLGVAGSPIRRGATGFRLNQGVVARGAGTCAMVWAYTFHSVVECFSTDGRRVWRTDGPVEIKPARGADPRRMSPKDVFAYTDVAVDGDRIYALFVGRRANDEGLHTRTVHVFDGTSGRFIGEWILPRQARFIMRRDSAFALLADEPGPVVHVYRVREREAP